MREIVTAMVQCWSLPLYPLEVRRVLLGDRTTTLIAGCRRHLYGDEFSVYHARMYPLVQRVVGKYLRGWPGEVDEVVNKVMVKLWRRWPLPTLENAYAAAAARNACLDHLECMQGFYAKCVSVEEDAVPELPGRSSLRPIVMTPVQGCAHRDEERLIAAALSELGCDQDVAPLEQSLAELVRHRVRELIGRRGYG